MTSSPFEISVEPVPRRTLGGTTITVGTIGLGCMGLTGVYDIERRDDRRSEAAVHRALDLGMTYLDTADSFGPFGNERFLGKVLATRRRDAVVATKVGITGRSDGTFHHNGTPEHIRRAVDESLRRLGTDHLDVYLLQAVDPESGRRRLVWWRPALRERWQAAHAQRHEQLLQAFAARRLRPLFIEGGFDADAVTRHFHG